MINQEMDMATCFTREENSVRQWCITCLLIIMNLCITTEFKTLYQRLMQPWTIHWKITYVTVHRQKYPIRNQGNLWRGDKNKRVGIFRSMRFGSGNKWNQMQELTRQFKAVSPIRKTALIECIMTINCHRRI